MWKQPPYCGLTRPLGPMLLANLPLYYVGKLSCRVQPYWSSGSWEQNFKNIFLYFVCLFVCFCLFINMRAIFQLSGGCHHCWWQGCKGEGAVRAKISPMSKNYVFTVIMIKCNQYQQFQQLLGLFFFHSTVI
jgi:hypothetical protein